MLKGAKALNRLATSMVFTQSAIVVTGAAVRLTGSGLGCSTWPECTPGSFTPTPEQPESPIHAWIEFGNRLLTFVLLLNALLLFVAILRNRRRDLRLLGAIQILGILAQGILGGITVLTGLNPATVVAHFLLSIILIAAALSLRQRALGVTPSAIQLSRTSKLLARIVLLLTVLVIFVGTVVTGSGPHAGDSLASRFPFDPKTVSWIHADLVIALIGLTVSLLFVVKLGETESNRNYLRPLIQRFLIISLAQGAIGYTQYFTGLPEVIVAAHILGAVLVWLSVWNMTIRGNVLSRP